MDWTALRLSFELAAVTCLVLLPLGALLARWLAYSRLPGKSFVEALLALPLVLPPTVLGFYVLEGIGGASVIGRWYSSLFGGQLAFSFAGLAVASVLFNLPFAVMPMQRAFEAIPADLRLAAPTCGLGPLATFTKIELPLAWPGIVSAMVMTLAHTLGEFGVVLMVGGNIPGETKTVAIAIYDRVQVFDMHSAGVMSLVLLAVSFATLLCTTWLNRKSTGVL